jgi:hypothetical protein
MDGGIHREKSISLHWEGDHDFVCADLGWAVAELDGEGRLFRCQDAGATWAAMQPVIIPRKPTTGGVRARTCQAINRKDNAHANQWK